MSKGGNLLAGFVRGATGYALSEIDERRRLEAEQQKLVALEQLRRETAEWEEGLPSKVQSRKESESRIAENAAQAKRDSERLALDRERLEHQRKSDADRLSLDQAELAETKRYHNESLKGSRRGGLDSMDDAGPESIAMQKILKANESMVKALTEAPEGVAPVVGYDRLYTTLNQIVTNSKTPAEAEQHFREYLISTSNMRARQADREARLKRQGNVNTED